MGTLNKAKYETQAREPVTLAEQRKREKQQQQQH